ncbi:hypothetical protein JTB14_016784 [Gonioctena quinquepunctata]|nr:hypothetical protein JTB14_016784 [Gonioctena quinquepunctata]
MPFGLHSAPATWQRFNDHILGADLDSYTFVYLDDVIICTSTFEKHMEVLDEVSAILNIHIPRNISEVKRIVGLASWYRRFIPSFSSVVSPLTQLTQKNRSLVWDENCEAALKSVEQNLVSAPILACPDINLTFFVETDTSNYGIGHSLSQRYQDGGKVICYLSRSLTKNGRKYSTTEKEHLAVLFTVEKLRPYLEATKFTVITDHFSLKWLFNTKNLVGDGHSGYSNMTSIFSIAKGKDHLVPDALSRAVPYVEIIDDHVVAPEQSTDRWFKKIEAESISEGTAADVPADIFDNPDVGEIVVSDKAEDELSSSGECDAEDTMPLFTLAKRLKNNLNSKNDQERKEICADIKKWNNVRDCFRRNINKIKNTPTGSGAKKQKQYVNHDLLTFLTPNMQSRRHEGNYDNGGEGTSTDETKQEDSVDENSNVGDHITEEVPEKRKKAKKDIPSQILEIMKQKKQEPVVDNDDDTKFLLNFRSELKTMTKNGFQNWNVTTSKDNYITHTSTKCVFFASVTQLLTEPPDDLRSESKS